MKISIFAEEGMILTDGKEYNDAFSLAKDRSPDEYSEITVEEYEKILEEKELDIWLLYSNKI